ncbi:hypothetical protein LPB19_05135 [Marinobacter salinisoli]|uniref:Nucleotide modification associated domain-containing protein n=1 Tax=Marinobacter salinisoli TaxID=2769486 RepID=A0ABX7MTT2_9GAMM|nr:hypothetical protein [Marinobacter salinisoli]QSP95797.1 hypothetical protein LPB19_05135 [Marinobacter salinisoli]
MRLILSRKGFDSSAGGCPSPVLPDGTLCVLPIPDEHSAIRYGDIWCGDRKLGKLVHDLSGGRVRAGHRAHLDPDIVAGAYPRSAGWRPVLGQAGSAQGHLRNQGVGAGDLFLFFGVFRQAELVRRRWRFVPGSRPFHALWGWLHIGEVVPVDQQTASRLPWAGYHPHLQGRTDGTDALYLASDSFQLPERSGVIPGSGAFPVLDESLVLTDPEGRLPTQWRLPAGFFPGNGRPPLSYHSKPGRWQLAPPWCYLSCAARGQEFVLDLAHYPELSPWLGGLLGGMSPPQP